ncbi:OmpA family protein [Gemmatimonas sp.]|jgi:peptidoglycan-associated lipoprotein|uniref:OmpA family protein n=1 Tax=Gemmatimonas sp. TaxID=1962908 RepID=UPI0031BD197C|nr:OmpA family protein [Gemmatimonas sp.]
MLRSSRLTLVLISSALVLGACKKKQPVAVAPTPTPTPAERVPERTTPRATPVDTMAAYNEKVSAARMRLLETIFFEYDADELRDDARTALDAKIAILNANPGLRIRVAGHCDERGSDEYNIALGRRRAEAAKRYLTDRGIDAARIETSSFGRERPAVQGTTEEAWSRNRRDEFEITAGGETLKPAS